MVVKDLAKKKTPPRRIPNRDERYMGIAFWWASFSKDPATQNGAQIVSEDNEPLGSGYNGPPAVYNDMEIDFGRPAKYNDMVHAEINAINHCFQRDKLKGSTIYVTAMPCAPCMLAIASAKIERVVYFPGKHHDSESTCDKSRYEDALDIAKKGKIKVDEFKGNLNWIRDRTSWMASVGIFD